MLFLPTIAYPRLQSLLNVGVILSYAKMEIPGCRIQLNLWRRAYKWRPVSRILFGSASQFLSGQVK